MKKFEEICFQATVSTYHYRILPYVFQNYRGFFPFFSLFVYLLHMYFNLVWLDYAQTSSATFRNMLRIRERCLFEIRRLLEGTL